MGTGYEVSSSYVAGLAKTLKALGHLEAVRAAVGPEGQEALEHPMANRWWDGAVNEQVIGALHQAAGEAAVEQVAYRTITQSMGPIVMPLVKVTLALSASTPTSLLSRSAQFLVTSVRGLEVTWTPSGSTAGSYAVRYPGKVPRAYLWLWKGMLSWVFELTGVSGELREAFADPDGQTFRYTLAWK